MHMNNALQDYKLLQKWSTQMGGVYSTSDLANLFNESNPVSLNRRICRLEESGVLTRFIRGYYTTGEFDAQVLSSRLCRNSYVSLGTVLAKELIIGSVPARTLYAVKTGRSRSFRKDDFSLQYLGIAPHLFFGFQNREGVNIATPEKAFLDTLYFYQKGRKFSYNIFTDITAARLDRERIAEYLKKYKNPRFIAFVKGYLNNHHTLLAPARRS
jgi:predicted transcriptional regulator of viral defense system